MPKVDVVVIAISSPLLVGVYEKGELIERFESAEMTSEALPMIFKQVLSKYQLNAIVYTRGPGSFMAIKVAYIFLQTLCIVHQIHLYATNAFTFNQNQPIKAFGKLYFLQKSGTITTQKFEEPPLAQFELPNSIDLRSYSEETAPLYILPAV